MPKKTRPEKSLKLTTKQPQGDANGLADPRVIKALMENPTKAHVALVLISVPVTEKDNHDGSQVGKVELGWIEPVLDNATGDADALKRIVTRLYERRTGATTLDASLEDAMREAIANVSLPDEDED